MRASQLILIFAVACSSGADPTGGIKADLRAAAPAQYMPGTIPAPQDGAPKVTEVASANNNIYPGQGDKHIGGRVGAGGVSVAISLENDVGYWVLPASDPDPLNPGEFSFATSLSFTTKLAMGTRNLVLVAIDANGRFGEPQKLPLTVGETDNPGILQVTLTWDTEADLDLHVVQPDGTELWRGHPSFFQPDPSVLRPTKTQLTAGGVLDFDSNAQCVIDGRRKEVITWKQKPATPAGQYTVRVDTFSLCGQTAANWKVHVVASGDAGTLDQTVAGFAVGTDTLGSHAEGAGTTALTFNVP